MYKVMAALAFVLLTMATASAQSHMASFHFEDAEAAFAARDYKTTLKHLDQAETALGRVNPPILHLRILALNELLHAGMPDYDFDILARLNAGCDQFLKEYGGIQAVREKAREVYNIAKKVQPYPKTQAERDAVRQAAARKAAADRAAQVRQARLKEIEALGSARVSGLEELTDAQFQRYQDKAFGLAGNRPEDFNRIYCPHRTQYLKECLYENEFIELYRERVGNDLDQYHGHRGGGFTPVAISLGAVGLGAGMIFAGLEENGDPGVISYIGIPIAFIGLVATPGLISIYFESVNEGPPRIPTEDAYRHIRKYNENVLQEIAGYNASLESHEPQLVAPYQPSLRLSAAPFVVPNEGGGLLVRLDF